MRFQPSPGPGSPGFRRSQGRKTGPSARDRSHSVGGAVFPFACPDGFRDERSELRLPGLFAAQASGTGPRTEAVGFKVPDPMTAGILIILD